jgi:hypothetical protein
VTERYGQAASVSFTDGLNGQTTCFYHVQLKGLKAGTRYYYQVSDGAHTPSTAGASFETRRPSVVATEAYEYNGTPAWNTAEGTVYLVLGGGGTNGPTNTYGTDAADDKPQAKVITTRNAVVGSAAKGFSKNGADSVEDAPWSAAINPTDAYGYSIFDVDPGTRPGETTITFQYFAIPAVTNEAGTAHDGTTTLPNVPTEKFVFGRKVGKK